MMVSCDQCRASVTDGVVGHCSQCGYDLCAACIRSAEKASVRISPTAKCSAGHSLQCHTDPYNHMRQLGEMGVRCNGCRRSVTEGYVGHCPTCKFDLCPRCLITPDHDVASSFAHPFLGRCRSGHPLQLVRDPYKWSNPPVQARCFLCRAPILEGYSGHCAQCQFDLCFSCLNAIGAVRVASPPSAGSSSVSLEEQLQGLETLSLTRGEECGSCDVRCPANHPLVWNEDPYGLRTLAVPRIAAACNLCSCDIVGSAAHCGDCSYDLCSICVDIHRRIPEVAPSVMCSHGHPLEWSTNPYGSKSVAVPWIASCNGCGTYVSSFVAHCSRCREDFCLSCVNQQESDVTSASQRQVGAEPPVEVSNVAPDPSKGAPEQEGEQQGQMCAICLSQPLQVALIPCGHVCTCSDCSSLVTTCPVCRLAISSRLRVYFAT